MTVHIGTSGWQYRHWRTGFYPSKLPQKEWLEYYAERFQVVEVNNTFYHLPAAGVFRAWRERTPGGFVFVPKMSRYLTHLKRLKDPQEPVERFMKAAGELKEKLGPVLIQLPPNMECDLERLEGALSAFPDSVRLAVEFRDDSWFVKPVRELLTARNAALCLADRGEKLVTPDWRTADWGYVRFHWGTARPESCYTDGAIRDWASRICDTWSDSEDVFAFFNNDPNCCAIADAGRLSEALVARKRRVTHGA